MPFNEASKDSFEIKVSGLELKLHPKRTPKESSIKDLGERRHFLLLGLPFL